MGLIRVNASVKAIILKKFLKFNSVFLVIIVVKNVMEKVNFFVQNVTQKIYLILQTEIPFYKMILVVVAKLDIMMIII